MSFRAHICGEEKRNVYENLAKLDGLFDYRYG